MSTEMVNIIFFSDMMYTRKKTILHQLCDRIYNFSENSTFTASGNWTRYLVRSS